MTALLISGAGTGIGKTFVTAALARAAAAPGRSIQIVKPVQTGVAAGEPSDADVAAAAAASPHVAAYTLQRFPAPLAPRAAAASAALSLDHLALVRAVRNLPAADCRLIEGAGGIAVPLGPGGWDWLDFAHAIPVTAIVLVVADELGAINQARLAFHYLAARGQPALPGGVILNSVRPAADDVRASTRAALAEAGVPLWGELGHHAPLATLAEPLARLMLP